MIIFSVIEWQVKQKDLLIDFVNTYFLKNMEYLQEFILLYVKRLFSQRFSEGFYSFSKALHIAAG